LASLPGHSFKKKKLCWSNVTNYWFIKLPRANSGFLFWRCIFWSFLFIFYIRLLGLELYNFFFVSILGLYRSHITGHVLVNLTWIVLKYRCLNIPFLVLEKKINLTYSATQAAYLVEFKNPYRSYPWISISDNAIKIEFMHTFHTHTHMILSNFHFHFEPFV